MDEVSTLVGQIMTLRASVGPLSAGTPMLVLEEGDTWVDVQTVVRMPHVKGFDVLDDRPIVSAMRKDLLVRRRQRSKVVNKK